MVNELLRIKVDTQNLINETIQNFIKINPEYEKVNFTNDKKVFEIFKHYNEILKGLDKHGEVKVFVK